MVFEDGLKFKKKKRTTAREQEKQKLVSVESVEGELEVYEFAMPEAADTADEAAANSSRKPDTRSPRPLKIPTVRLKEL